MQPGRSRSPFLIAIAAFILLFATFAQAQDSHVFFDPNGNLFVQTAAVTALPQITGQPQNRIVAPGDSASFFVVAHDTRALSYQWRFNGLPLGGSATNDAVLLQNVSTNNEGEYRVVLTNPSGSATSAPALLIIDSDADGVGDSWEFTYFGSLTNSATTDADGDGSSNLQEYRDDTNPSDANSVLRHLTIVRDGGSVIANPDLAGYTNGQIVTLTSTSIPGKEPFHAWLGDVVTRSNSVTLVMTNNKTLHARFTPIVFIWTNSASGDWNVAANWAPNLAPGSNDSIVIPNNAIVTLNTPAVCADVTLGSAGSIPTLTGSGTLRVRSSFLWQSGTMGGTGRTVIDSGATMVVVSSSAVTLHTRALENGGTVLWTGAGNFNLVFNAVITNRAGALIQVQNAASIGGGVDLGRLDNAGTFRKSGNAGTTTFSSGMSLNNSGAVEIQAGTLNLGFGGTHTGSFNVPAGTALIFSGGTHTGTATSSIAGAGQFVVSGGIAHLAGLVNVSGSNIFSVGAANLTGNYICTNNTVTISSGGTANFSGTGLVSPSVVNLDGGVLGGNRTVTVNNLMNWTGGQMSGSGRTIIPAGAALNVSNPGVVSVATRTLENGGTLLWTGAGNFGVSGGAVITNRAGALFHVQSSASFTLNGFDSGRIDNAGTFRKSTQAGTTAVGGSTSFNNSGTVDLQVGTLSLGGGGTHSGSFAVAAGTALSFSSGTHTAGPASSLTGAGQLIVSGGAANFAGFVNVSGNNTFSGGTANLTGNYICTNNTMIISIGTAHFSGTGLVSPSVVDLSSGALGGTSVVTVNNLMNWTAGNMSGNGRTIIAAGATLNIANPGTVQLNPRALENGGTVFWTGAGNIALFGGSVITNRVGALFHAQNATSFSWPGGGDNGRIDNAGTFRKSANSGTMTVGNAVAFNNSGTVDIRNGIVAANGIYTSTANALLNCILGGVAPGIGYSRLQVAGNVTLAGNLSVALANNFVPPANSLYTVLSAGTRNGSFANFSYPTNDADMVVSNTPSSVVIRALGPYFATTTLPDAMRNVGYTQQVTAVMNDGPIAYSLITGALPTGLSFSAGGAISGIPTNFGLSTFTIQASNAAGVTIQQAFNLRVRNLPPEGLISWWRAENNALDSIGTNHGVLTNGATFAAGNAAQAFALDGVNDYVHIPDSPDLRPASLTLEAWAMFNSQNGPVFCKPFGPAGGDSFALYLLSGTLHGFIHDTNAAGVLVSSPSPLSLGQWHHVAFSFDDSTKEQALYINGVRVATSLSNRSIGYDSKPVLLGQDINNGNFDFPLNGRIDEASIYNRALSTNEIAATYLAGSAGKPLDAPYFVTAAQLPDAAQMLAYTQQVRTVLGTGAVTFSASSGGLPSGLDLSSDGIINGVPTVAGTDSFVLRATDSLGAYSDQLTTLRVIAPAAAPSGLVSWWRGEGNALDSAGANHGTTSNGVVYVQGKVGQGFGFDGINDFVFVPDATNLRPASITLEAWAKFNGTLGPVMGRTFGAAVHNSYILWQLNGNINGTIGDAPGADVLSTPFAPATGQWYHVAVTFDAITKQQTLYLNGAVVAYNQSLRSIAYDNHPVLIGGDIDNGSVSFLLNGGVDEAAIYNRALTAAEIAGIYSAGIAGKQILGGDIPPPSLLMPEIVGLDINVIWTAVPNATYRLEYNPDLANLTNWIAIPGDIVTTSNTASKLDPLGRNDRFYRVRILP